MHISNSKEKKRKEKKRDDDGEIVQKRLTGMEEVLPPVAVAAGESGQFLALFGWNCALMIGF